MYLDFIFFFNCKMGIDTAFREITKAFKPHYCALHYIATYQSYLQGDFTCKKKDRANFCLYIRFTLCIPLRLILLYGRLH